MPNKYQYRQASNSLYGPVEMEYPDTTKILGGSPSGSDYEALDELREKYMQHLNTLPLYCKVDAGLKFVDEQIVGKGEYFQIKYQARDSTYHKWTDINQDSFHLYQDHNRQIIAVPLLPATKYKNEETIREDHDEAIELIEEYFPSNQFKEHLIDIIGVIRDRAIKSLSEHGQEKEGEVDEIKKQLRYLCVKWACDKATNYITNYLAIENFVLALIPSEPIDTNEDEQQLLLDEVRENMICGMSNKELLSLFTISKK